MQKVRHRYLDYLTLIILLVIACSPAVARPTLTQQQAVDEAGDLKDFTKFLDNHPEILSDLERDRSLIADPEFLSSHPELKEFLATHPDLAKEFNTKFMTQNCNKTAPDIFDKVSPAVVF